MTVSVLPSTIHFDADPFSVRAIAKSDDGAQYKIVVPESVVMKAAGHLGSKAAELVRYVRYNIVDVEERVDEEISKYAARREAESGFRTPPPDGTIIVVTRLA
jgi:hypothetical protein